MVCVHLPLDGVRGWDSPAWRRGARLLAVGGVAVFLAVAAGLTLLGGLGLALAGGGLVGRGGGLGVDVGGDVERGVRAFVRHRHAGQVGRFLGCHERFRGGRGRFGRGGRGAVGDEASRLEGARQRGTHVGAVVLALAVLFAAVLLPPALDRRLRGVLLLGQRDDRGLEQVETHLAGHDSVDELAADVARDHHLMLARHAIEDVARFRASLLGSEGLLDGVRREVLPLDHPADVCLVDGDADRLSCLADDSGSVLEDLEEEAFGADAELEGELGWRVLEQLDELVLDVGGAGGRALLELPDAFGQVAFDPDQLDAEAVDGLGLTGLEGIEGTGQGFDALGQPVDEPLQAVEAGDGRGLGRSRRGGRAGLLRGAERNHRTALRHGGRLGRGEGGGGGRREHGLGGLGRSRRRGSGREAGHIQCPKHFDQFRVHGHGAGLPFTVFSRSFQSQRAIENFLL